MNMSTSKKVLVLCLLFAAIIGVYLLDRAIRPDKVEVAQQAIKPTSMPSPLLSPTPSGKTYAEAPPMTIDKSKSYTAVLVTNKGEMKVKLIASETPVTVNNFVFLANEGFYDGTRFHRIMKDFMIQGGDPTGTGSGGPGYTFDDEPVTLKYVRGTLAMANAGVDTNGSQFFIIHADSPHLPPDYTIFGLIDANDGASLATLDAIANTKVAPNQFGELSSPLETVTIETVRME
jgi:cyclophilin family peptidyl-prolyl cis-trans isomerase